MKMHWFLTAFLSMILFVFVYLLMKKATLFGVDNVRLYFYYTITATTTMIIYALVTKGWKGETLGIPTGALVLIVIAAIIGTAGNLLFDQSLIDAPNPGYALAVSNANVILIAIASVFLFSSELSWIKTAGIVLTIAGIVLLGL